MFAGIVYYPLSPLRFPAFLSDSGQGTNDAIGSIFHKPENEPILDDILLLSTMLQHKFMPNTLPKC